VFDRPSGRCQPVSMSSLGITTVQCNGRRRCSSRISAARCCQASIGRSETGLPAAPGKTALAPPAASPFNRASRLE
jgi:hypothetical protein